MVLHTKILARSELSMNFVTLRTGFLEIFQIKPYEPLQVKIGNMTINTKMAVKNRMWNIPLKKLGFKVGDIVTFSKTGPKEVTIQKLHS